VDLRTTPLAGKPLGDALASLGRAFTSETGIPVRVDADPTLKLPLRTEAELFRIAQEALTNVRKHARAHEVQVSLRRHGPNLVLQIRDDGRGFAARARPPGDGHGLIGMRERAKLLDGRLLVSSAPSRGTRILARIPATPSGAAG
jgi:signal transduction histidine kinase